MPGFRRMVLVMSAFAVLIHGEQAIPQAASKITSPTMTPSASASPSLKETTEWLENHLVGQIYTSRKTIVAYKAKKGKEAREVERQASNTHESVSVANFEGCTLTLGQLVKGDDYTAVTVSTIPLDQVTGASWKMNKIDPVITQNGLDSTETTVAPASVTIITLQASTNSISWRRKSTGNVPLEQDAIPYEGRGASIEIHSDDLAMPPRLVKAFNHAIDLCRATVKPEPF